MEDLDRGVVAVSTSDTSVFISWRLLATDPDTISFNIYRGAIKINDSPITKSTNFVDYEGSNSSTYHVVPVLDGVEQDASDTVNTWNQNYISVPLQIPDGGITPNNDSYTYSANDCSIGDLDGDGEYEIVLKWDPSNSHDNSHSGYTGNVYIDAYKMDGTQLWRIDLGINIRAGAHYTQFMVYDLDGDGIAEVACKTAPGTKDATGNYIALGPASGADHTTDYRNSSGFILEGPEYFTIFDGETGNELATADYIPPRGDLASWGDTDGNRVDRFLACIAYLDGSKPSVVMCRGYYRGSGRGRTVLAAWDYRNDTLTHRWTFDADLVGEYPEYTGQGNHNLSVADVDDDGKDEIIYGACTIDDDGTGLYSSGLGHGDAMHVSDIDPDRPGLEIWTIHENASKGSALRDAKTGEIIWSTGSGDVGRGVSADLVASHFGMECWGGTDGLRSAKNIKVGDNPSSSNHVIWWDGDLTRELLNSNYISKYGSSLLLVADGCSSINGTKSNPNLQADILGDWREEVIFRTDDNSALRIYTTTDTTSYRIITLMQDHVYRLGIAWQNVAYNQPPHTGFYLGADMFVPDSLRPPAIPLNFIANAMTDSVFLNWDDNYDGDLAGYNVFRSKSQDRPFEKLNDSVLILSQYTDTNVINDTIYYYAVTSVDSFNNESEYSKILKAIPTYRPASPTGIYQRNDSSAIKIFWSEVTTDNVTGYNVYRSETTGGSYEKLNSSLLLTTEYLDSPLTTNKTFYYVVTSEDNESLESFNSVEVSTTTGPTITIQAEDAIYTGVVYLDENHLGFNGTGFANFELNGTIAEFVNMPGFGGGYFNLIYRYALGNTDRTGSLIVNEETQNLTMKGTGEWTNWVIDSATIKLNPGFSNNIKFATTGSDFGNLDEITIMRKLAIIDTTDNDTIDNSNIENYTELSHGGIELLQNYPNPFNHSIQIRFNVKEQCTVSIIIYNSLGQTIRTLSNAHYNPGLYEVTWNARDDNNTIVQGGLYFCRINTNLNYYKSLKILYIGN
ncbi:T9SS type A sorting domain-containing protein [Bacteroidota bacterium]